jgi:hypothetical protein
MTRPVLIVAMVATVIVAAAAQQEKLTLTTPVTATLASYSNDTITVSRTPAVFVVELTPDVTNAARVTCTWGSQVNPKGLVCSNGFVNENAPTGYADVLAMIKTFNKTNFAAPNPSMNKWVCTQLIADGAFTGTCTGTPQ